MGMTNEEGKSRFADGNDNKKSKDKSGYFTSGSTNGTVLGDTAILPQRREHAIPGLRGETWGTRQSMLQLAAGDGGQAVKEGFEGGE